MALDLLNTIAALGTFVVIAATALAASIQLRHLRQNNELQAVLALRSERSQALEDAYEFARTELSGKLEDPRFRAELEAPSPRRTVHKELTLCDYFEHIGVYIKHGLIDENVYFEIGSPENYWPYLEPVIAIYRRQRGPSAYENFEYLVMRARRFNAEHPRGTYPADAERLIVRDAYAAVDSASARASDDVSA